MREAVITGIGMICSLGATRERVWKRLITGSPRMGRISAFKAVDFGLQGCVVAEIPDSELEGTMEELARTSWSPPNRGRFQRLAFAAAVEAFLDAGGEDLRASGNQGGLLLATMSGGMQELERIVLTANSGRRVKAQDNIGKRASIAVQNIARALSLNGPAFGVDAACAGGAVAVAHAARLVSSGSVNWCLAGGVEASIVPSSIAMSHSVRILSTAFADEPPRSSRPFDRRRDGYVPAEGACFLVVESIEAAQRRRARVYARLRSTAEATDWNHPTRLSDPFVEGLMRRCLESCRVEARELGWINAHATSTQQGDRAEANAVSRLLDGTAVPVSAPKSVTGHLLGASGAFEAAFSALSLAHQCIPPTINRDEPDPECPVSCPRVATPASFRFVLSNSFGFGGLGCCLLLEAS